MSAKPKSIAVLGAGITGLTAAYRLCQAGHSVSVFEAADRAGGVIRTHSEGEWLIEAGPNSLLAGDPLLNTLIDELELAPERLSANRLAQNRYIVRRGKLVPVPMSPPALLRSSLFSFSAKLSIVSEMLMRPRSRHADVSLEDLIRAHFGREVVDYALNPFITGVYAGNPGKLSARHAFPKLWEAEQRHGSLLRGQMAGKKSSGERRGTGIISFRRGLQMLPDALANRLPSGVLKLQHRVEALLPPEGARWSVIWNEGGRTHSGAFDSVVAALPASGLAALRFGPLGERPMASLDAIEHPPVASIFLGYRRTAVQHPLDGFGVLVPEVEKRNVLGVLFSSTLFPGRAPADHVAVTVLVGGTRQPELARLPEERLLAAITPDLQSLLGVTGPPLLQHHTFWPKAIPQYNLGFDSHLETMAKAERSHPGLFIGGQARDGISLPACIAAGEKLATRAG